MAINLQKGQRASLDSSKSMLKLTDCILFNQNFIAN